MKLIFQISLYLLVVLFTSIPFCSFSADHVTMTLQNETHSSNTIEFDIYIVNDGTTSLRLRGYSFGINFSPTILNGGTPASTSYISLPNSRDPIFNALANNNAAYNNSQLKNVVTSVLPALNGVLLPFGVPLKLGRFQFTNTVSWTAGSVPAFQFQSVTATGKTNSIAVVYYDSLVVSANLTHGATTLLGVNLVPGLTLNIPLPVHLTSFAGIRSGHDHILNWTSSEEKNNHYYDLQHSKDGFNFTTLEKVYSKADQGNSDIPLSYSVRNTSTTFGHNYYRLQQFDINGQLSIPSEVIDLEETMGENQINIYPNPAGDIIRIQYTSDKTAKVIIRILDINGRSIKLLESVSHDGLNDVPLNIHDLSKGTYFIQVVQHNAIAQIMKFSKISE